MMVILLADRWRWMRTSAKGESKVSRFLWNRRTILWAKVSMTKYIKKYYKNLRMLYNPELEKAIRAIKEKKAQTVCIQLPDGMKQYAQEIVDEIESKTKARVLIWLGSNFGAYDLPLGLNRMGVDMLISWG